ncbi:MAG: tetratricopeptide repeat protein [Cryomorphaceae bacterium]
MQYVKSLLVALIILPTVAAGQMTMAFDNDLLTYNTALELFHKQKYGAAKQQFESAIATVENDNSEVSANAHFYVAACALELFHKDAEYLLKEFVRNYSTSPRVTEAWFLLGSYNYRKKDWDDAIEFFDQIEPEELTEPDRSEYLFKKGYSYFQEEQYENAADQFFQMKDQFSIYYAPGVYYFAHINYEQGNYATALKSFKSLEGHPQFGEVVPYYIVQIYHFQNEYDNLVAYGTPFLGKEGVKRKAEISRLVGEAMYSKGKYAEATPFLEDYMASRLPKQAEDYYVLGYAYYRSGKYDKAAEQFSKISYSDDAIGQSAAYHLGETYLKAKKKSYARNAYRSASRMDHLPVLKEDALYKYAQLCYELSYDPYDGAIAAFKEYIDAYPASERTKEAFDYLVNIYLTSNNYDAALSSIEEYESPDIRLKEAYQRIAFNKGVSLYQDRMLAEAIKFFDRSLKFPQNKVITAEANYWKAEALYYRGDFDEAVKHYEAFIYTPGAALTPYFNTANYNIGYAYFQQDKFIEAPSWFRRFTSYSKEKDKVKLTDANLRIGDSYFMLTQYGAAMDYYLKAVKMGSSDPDYALYQTAMTHGLLNDIPAKVVSLQKLTSSYPDSRYLDAAHYEMGRANIRLGKQELALQNLQKVVDDFPGSSYVRKALVSIGQTYYNQEKDDEALAIFMRIIKEYPTYEDTREALIGVQNIYSDRGKVEEYENLIGSLDFVNISDMALDSINYEAAENQYFNGQCKEAVVAFNKYLGRFEKGIFSLNAKFYRAECMYKMGQTKDALGDYEFVANQPKNRFSESALVKAARINFANNNYPDALAYYRRLSLLGEYKENLLESEIGQMRCNYQLNNYQGAIANAIITLESDKIDDNVKNEANLIIAKANLKLDSPKEAGNYLVKVVAKGGPSQAAEAMYLQARIQFRQDSLDSAEALVFSLVDRYQSQSFWLGKSLLLLTDIYMTRGDLFQAKATLNSVLENYKKDDEVKQMAQEKLATIEELESASDEEAAPELEINFQRGGTGEPTKELENNEAPKNELDEE